MDRLFFHVHSIHELVAKLRVRNLELVTRVASLFRLGRACHVLHRLVCIGPPSLSRITPLNIPGHRKNRPFVEDKVEQVLRRVDLLDIHAYYARSPASGLWLLEYGNKIIGMIAVDASPDASNDEPITQQSSGEQLRELLERKGTSRIATIRHFFAEEAYRRVKIEDDLLEFAVEKTFTANKSVSTVRISASPLRPAILESIKRNRFAKGDRVESIGMLSWEVCWYNLERSRWEAAKQEGK